jgi:predicted enzyme related to lactoylglutathione lyase
MKVETVKFMIMAQDMKRARAFWSGAFGFKETFVDEHWSEMDTAHGTLALHGGHDGTTNRTGLSVQVDSIVDGVIAVQKAGGAVVSDPQARPGEPIKLAEAEDTEGNRFSIVEYIGSSPRAAWRPGRRR